MRWRCFAFVPPAALITSLLLFLSSSIVSALNESLTQSLPPSVPPLAHTIIRLEADCDFMARRLAQVTQDLDSCDASPGCLRFPLLCSMELHDDLLQEKTTLASAHAELCVDGEGVNLQPNGIAASAISWTGSAEQGCEADGASCAVRLCETPWTGEDSVSSSSGKGTFLF